MSALPPKADIFRGSAHVRFVPKADIWTPSRTQKYGADEVAVEHHLAGENAWILDDL